MSDAELPIVYLDHAASSPMRPEVRRAMEPFADVRFGNPSGVHRAAHQARRALEEAREMVAAEVGAQPGEVVFTSGGTEAANLAILGTLAARRADGLPSGSVICSAVEHAAVLETCRAARPSGATFGEPGVPLREAPVDASGVIDLPALELLLTEGVALVSVMLANNEVGTIQPVEEVARLVRERAPNAAVHTDAVQAATYLDLAVDAADTDLLSISGHKLGGPQGIGALVIRGRASVRPLILGGGQERARRSGTPNVAGAVGLATALRISASCRVAESARVAALRDELAGRIAAAVPGTVRSVGSAPCLPGHCHLRFDGIEQEELLVLLDQYCVCASGGSACASGALEPSHVLTAMGVPAKDARSAIRFTLGYTTTAADVETAVGVVREAVASLRADRS